LSHKHKPTKKLLQTTIPYPCAQTQVALDKTWGHSLQSIENLQMFRLLLQNPNGIHLKDTYQYKYGLSLCKSHRVGAVCISETKINSNLYDLHEKMHSAHSEVFQASSFQSSQTPDAFVNTFQPEGILTLVCDLWATRVIEGGAYPCGLGRWSFLTLRGKNDRKITIVTAYRVSTDLAGPMTSTMQQYRKISLMTITEKYTVRPQPRWQVILDLQAWLEKIQSDNYEIILALDANEEFHDENGSITPFHCIEGNHVNT
jgi:hypothetical protein